MLNTTKNDRWGMEEEHKKGSGGESLKNPQNAFFPPSPHTWSQPQVSGPLKRLKKEKHPKIWKFWPKLGNKCRFSKKVGNQRQRKVNDK